MKTHQPLPPADEIARYIQRKCPRCGKHELRIFRRVYERVEEIRCASCGGRWAGDSTQESLWILEVEADPQGCARRIVRQSIFDATGSWHPPECLCGEAAGAKWLRLKTDREWDRGEEKDTVRLACLRGVCEFAQDVPIRLNDEDRQLLEKFCAPEVARAFDGFRGSDSRNIVLTAWGTIPSRALFG